MFWFSVSKGIKCVLSQQKMRLKIKELQIPGKEPSGKGSIARMEEPGRNMNNFLPSFYSTTPPKNLGCTGEVFPLSFKPILKILGGIRQVNILFLNFQTFLLCCFPLPAHILRIPPQWTWSLPMSTEIERQKIITS